MKMNTKDWSALLDLYPENKTFIPTGNIKTVIDCISSAYNGLDKASGEIILTSEIFPKILIDENVLLFFITLYRTDIIDDLFLPVGISKGSGELINFHYGPDYLGNHDVAYIDAINDPKTFKKHFVSFRISNWKAFEKVREVVYEKLNVKESVVADNKLTFDNDTGILSLNGRQTEVPINTNQFYLAKKLFDVPAGTRVKEIDIMDMIDWSKDSNRSVYDAMRLVNKRAKEHLGIPELFHWRMNTVWREQ
ncbi:MAG: hypothetical protein WAV15_00730 [Minisyncoccia bacterium]